MIKVGDQVRTRPVRKKDRPQYGVVKRVVPFDPTNPIESHGCVYVDLNGEEEHFAHYRWEEMLEVIE